MEMKAKNEFDLDRLIPMVDYVLEHDLDKYEDLATCMSHNRGCLIKLTDYANLLKQKPELWMFIPCDENGNVLEEPLYFKKWINETNYTGREPKSWELECEQYQQAKERIIFKGWEYDSKSGEGYYISNGISRMHFDYTNTHVIFFKDKNTPNKSELITSLEQLTKFNLELL